MILIDLKFVSMYNVYPCIHSAMYIMLHTDINECTGTHGCSHGCTNTIGSFLCTCPDGLFLSDDGQNCEGNLRLIFCFCSYLNAIVLQAVQ